MSSELTPVLRKLSQFDYCSIGAHYLLEYQELQSYVQRMSIDAIKAHMIAIDAFCKAIRQSGNFKTWNNLVTCAKLTAKAAGENYINNVPLEVKELPVDLALDQCKDLFETSDIKSNRKGAELYRDKALGQFGSMEEILNAYLNGVIHNQMQNCDTALTKAVSVVEYMQPRYIMKMLINIRRFLSSRPTKIQHLFKDIMLEGTNSIQVEEIPDVYSMGYCNYELHRTIFLVVAPLLNRGWPFAIICWRLRKEITKNNPMNLGFI